MVFSGRAIGRFQPLIFFSLRLLQFCSRTLRSDFSEHTNFFKLSNAHQTPTPPTKALVSESSSRQPSYLTAAAVFTCKMIWVISKRNHPESQSPFHFWGCCYKCVTSDLPDGGLKKWISPLGPLRCHTATSISDISMSQHLLKGC